MSSRINKKIAGIVGFILVLNLFLPAFTARAQIGVPIYTGFDFQSTKTYVKTFVLDKLAYTIAKTFIQRMTADIVDWINSGYQGNPAFLDDPQGFFIDSADQVTGAFIAGSGPLTGLCNGFNLDLRLNLALDQVQLARNRYACTLNTIINNAKNASAHVSIGTDPNGMTLGDIMNGDVTKNANDISINGTSIDNTDEFMRGDFGYGGWPAFVALTTEPQNNTYGAYLQARYDLMQRQAETQNAYNRDLDRGKGFLSWEKCKEVGRANYWNDSDIYNIEKKTQGDSTIKIEMDGQDVIYKSCKTETPGSVVAGTLQSNVDSPLHQLELADSFGEIIDAATRQLVNKMITSGLGALSKSSGGAISVTTDLRAQATKIQSQMYTNSELTALPQVQMASSTVTQVRDIYAEALNTLKSSKEKLEGSRSCFSTLSASIAERKLQEANSMISSLDFKVQQANRDLEALNMSIIGLDSSGGLDTIERQQEQAAAADRAVQIATDAYRRADSSMADAKESATKANELSAELNSISSTLSSTCWE